MKVTIEDIMNYELKNILRRYPDDLKEEVINIINETIELNEKEGRETTLDDVMIEIFGTGLVQLRKYNELRKEIQ